MNLFSLASLATAISLLAVSGCGGPSSPAKSPDEAPAKTVDGGVVGEGGAPAPVDETAVCAGVDLDLMNVLMLQACEVPSDSVSGKMRDVSKLLEVKVTVSPNTVTPGGHADVLVTYTNKSSDLLPLDFQIDPTPRFPVEVYGAKTNKRAEMPTTPHPPGRSDEGASPTIARVKLFAGGKATAHVDWSAVKLKWAPELLKGTPPEQGFPTVPAGPLPKGSYILKVITPLVGIFEGFDKEVSTQKVPVVVQ